LVRRCRRANVFHLRGRSLMRAVIRRGADVRLRESGRGGGDTSKGGGDHEGFHLFLHYG
jgi:hypothetical protein